MGTNEYYLKISRLTIDKLGVKLYDKVSAVVAELLANSYDADAEKVTIKVPLSCVLATKKDGKIIDKGYVIEIKDDGHGMTPIEASNFYLKVGRDRREHIEQGSKSRDKKRPVMGRKGIGKLAPFGICKKIEVISAGGKKTNNGYLVSHFIMDYDNIVADDESDVPLTVGSKDGTYSNEKGTTIKLYDFLKKLVPDKITFHRQLASRFVFAKPDFEIWVENTINDEKNKVERTEVAIRGETKIDLSERPITTEEGEKLEVKGWLAMAKVSYKNEEMSGVRIYARNKIVATTRDFEQPAGFTGEFTIRSYLVGEVYADWLDNDNGEDLIRSDRQGILWDSDYGRALREWGAKLIKEIGKLSTEPRRQNTREIFLTKSNFIELANTKFKDKAIVDTAIDLAKQIGGFAAEDELENKDYVDGLAQVILTVAPHKALIEAFEEFNIELGDGEITLASLSDIFTKSRVAEMASYSQIASERVKALEKLEHLINADKINENEFQELLEKAPWIIEPTWSVITKNESLRTFKTTFESYYNKKYNETIELAIGYQTKRPDFILISLGHTLHIVEIKPKDHIFNDDDFKRLINYYSAFNDFFVNHEELTKEFPNKFLISVITDSIKLKEPANNVSYKALQKENVLRQITWLNLLLKAKTAHKEFLKVKEKINEKKKGS